MIGRMAIARPWIFAQIADGLRPGAEVFARAALEMVRLLERHYDPVRALRRFKRWAQYFCANYPFGHTLHTRLINVDSLAAAADCLQAFFDGDPVPAARPNMNFMR
jgi:tRNA-dihydrouridine synthase